MPSGKPRAARNKARCSICHQNTHDRRRCPQSPASLGAFGEITGALFERLFLLTMALDGPAYELRPASIALDTLLEAGSVELVSPPTLRGIRSYRLTAFGAQSARSVGKGFVVAGEAIERAIASGLTAGRKKGPDSVFDLVAGWAERLRKE